MKIWAAVLFLALMGAGLASGQLSAPKDLPEVPAGTVVCDAKTCIIPRADIEALRNELRVQFVTGQLMEQALQRQHAVIEQMRVDREKKCTAILKVLPRTVIWM